LKIYHFSGDRLESERFFSESLSEYIETTGLKIPASALRDVGKGPHGKPYFTDPALKDIFFSRSHTEGHEIVVFSDKEIGIDCENTEARPGIEDRYMGIAGRYFTDDEQAYIDGSVERFYEIWTSKEAYMKYTGKGFSEGFRSFSALTPPGAIIETGRVSGAPHIVYSVCAAGEGHE